MNIKFLKLEHIMLDNPILRSLVQETSLIFKSVQAIQEREEPLTREQLVKSSRMYRSVMYSNYAKFENFIPANDEIKNATIEGKEMLLKIEIAWSLCEILFIDIHSSGSLLSQLLTWIRWHFPDITKQAEDILQDSNAYNNPEYWNIIIQLVLRGEVLLAKKLIKLHPDAEGNLLVISHLLTKMPVFSKDQILYEFYMRWQNWHSLCTETFNESAFLFSHEQLILGILAGDLSTFKKVTRLCSSWYHFMIASVLYKDPLLKETDLHSLSKECFSLYNGNSETTPFDEILIHGFAYDLMSVIQEACVAFKDNWWFVSHFIDLLYNGNLLDSNEIEEPLRLREFFILDYADTLITNSDLWYIAVNYFEACPEQGMQFLQLNLERMPIENEVKAMEIIDLAEKYEFYDVRRSVAIYMSKKWLAKKRLGQALVWAVKSKSASLTTHISDLFLKEFVETKKFPDEDVLNSLGNLMLTSDRLTFLAKYHEFNDLKKKGMLSKASIEFENLITSRIAPNFFLLTLLMDSIPLLEAETPILNTEQTYQILVALENFLNTCKQENKQDQDLKEKEDYLRLAIARNMARAMVLAL